jgi:AmiR/NasT family two-component response regulator
MDDTLPSPKNHRLEYPRTGDDRAAAPDRTLPRARGGADAAHEFASLSICAVVEPDVDGEALIRDLQRTHARVAHVWPPPAAYPVGYDVLFSELLEDLPTRLPWSPGEFPLALCVVVRERARLSLAALRDSTPHGTISLPLRRNDVAAALAISLAQFQYERRLRARIDKLDDYIRAIRSVERAKAVIMARKQIDENEAYHYLRRQAMARRISIGELALAIVDTDELLS